MDPKAIIDSADNVSNDLGAAIKNSRAALKKSMRNLEKRIMSALKDIETGKKGQLVRTRENLKQLNSIHKKLVVYFDEYYEEGVYKSLKGFERVAKSIEANWPDLDNAIEYTSIDKDMMEVLANQSLEEFKQFGDTAREHIAKSMYDHVIAGGSFGELVTEVASILGTGIDARGNNMARYAELWANDVLMNFHQAVTLKKASDAGLNYFLYYGNVIETSRQFCIDRAGKVFSEQEIKSWNGMTWRGKSGPPLTRRGGYNCRHHWHPVKRQWIPSGEIDISDYYKEKNIDIPRGGTLPL